MTDPTWTAVDNLLADLLVGADPALDAALAESDAAGLPAISVTPTQGKLLHLIARMAGARNILEIGTLGGYSALWLARALSAGGRLITLEADENYAALAEANLRRAGLDAVVEVRRGLALTTLPQLAAEKCPPFDLVFIDADKENTAAYFTWSLKLTRPGSLIIVDNVVRKGAILDPDTADPHVQGIRRFLNLLAAEKRVAATAIQTVGSKGHDGFVLAIVTENASN